MRRPIRHDRVADKRVIKAVLLFVAAMLGLFAAFGWVMLTMEDGQAQLAPGWAVVVFFLLVFVSVGNVFAAYGKLRWFYRCPQCRARLPRVPEAEAGNQLHYFCAACDVEWDTGCEWTAGGD